MPAYFHAVDAHTLRAFPAWPEQSTSDGIVFIDEELVVRVAPDPDADVVYAGAGDAWAAFCRDHVGFAVPDWERESAEVRQALSGVTA